MRKSRVDSDGKLVPQRFIHTMIAEHKLQPGVPIPSRKITSDASRHPAPRKSVIAKLPGSVFLFTDTRGIKYYKRTKTTQWIVLPPAVDGVALVPPGTSDIVKAVFAIDGKDERVAIQYAVTEAHTEPGSGRASRKTGWVCLQRLADE